MMIRTSNSGHCKGNREIGKYRKQVNLAPASMDYKKRTHQENSRREEEDNQLTFGMWQYK